MTLRKTVQKHVEETIEKQSGFKGQYLLIELKQFSVRMFLFLFL